MLIFSLVGFSVRVALLDDVRLAFLRVLLVLLLDVFLLVIYAVRFALLRVLLVRLRVLLLVLLFGLLLMATQKF